MLPEVVKRANVADAALARLRADPAFPDRGGPSPAAGRHRPHQVTGCRRRRRPAGAGGAGYVSPRSCQFKQNSRFSRPACPGTVPPSGDKHQGKGQPWPAQPNPPTCAPHKWRSSCRSRRRLSRVGRRKGSSRSCAPSGAIDAIRKARSGRFWPSCRRRWNSRAYDDPTRSAGGVGPAGGRYCAGSTGRTLAAWAPFGPWVMSNSTVCPSFSER